MNVLFALSLILAPSFVQDFTVTYNTKENSTSREVFDFPESMVLFNVEKAKVKVDIEGLTFIQVWSTCCGGEPEVWAKAREIEKKFGDRGLRTLSINFENGTVLPQQIDRVTKYMVEAEPPGELLVDSMGDVVDLLNVHAFPTYLLVSPEKKVFFKTNGKDPNGVQLLIEELDKLLPPA